MSSEPQVCLAPVRAGAHGRQTFGEIVLMRLEAHCFGALASPLVTWNYCQLCLLLVDSSDRCNVGEQRHMPDDFFSRVTKSHPIIVLARWVRIPSLLHLPNVLSAYRWFQQSKVELLNVKLLRMFEFFQNPGSIAVIRFQGFTLSWFNFRCPFVLVYFLH